MLDRAPIIPELLYKYLPSDRVSVLENGLMRFTQPGDLNDPFELRAVFKSVYSEQELARLIDRTVINELQAILPSIPKQHRPQLMAVARERAAVEIRPQYEEGMTQVLQLFNNLILPQAANTAVGVLSLTEDPLSLLMWAHYAQSHQGFVIQLNTKSAFFAPQAAVHEDFGKLHQVKYSKRRLEFDISASEASNAIDMLCTKPSEWAYEREWRLVRPLSSCNKRMSRPPFDICLYQLPPDAVDAVFVGDRISRASWDSIAAALGPAGYFSTASLFGVRMHESEFSLDTFPVTKFEDLQTDENRSVEGKQLVAQVEAARAAERK